MMMRRTCSECPWLLASAPGKFPPERYLDLAHTCKPGEFPIGVFACHMSPEHGGKACAGAVVALAGDYPNSIRMLIHAGMIDPARVQARGPLYPSYRAMAAANGCDPTDPAFDGMPA